MGKKTLGALLLVGGCVFGCGQSTDLNAPSGTLSSQAQEPSPTYKLLKQDILINADMWDTQPRMMAAGLGFTGIIGVPGLDVTQPEQSERLVREAGGTWNTVESLNAVLDNFTSAITPQGVALTYGYPVVYSDGLPVEFSWPIRPSTLDPTDFVVILNTGERVTPAVCSLVPNADYNERAVAVLFGKFGNRFSPEDSQAVYPVRVEVVEDDTPLQLVGPGSAASRGPRDNLTAGSVNRPGPTFISAVGMGVNSGGSPYTDADVAPEARGGPRLVGAKLSVMSALGDSGPALLNPPANDGITLYGDQAQYRLRVFTSGGFSPDGVRAIYPTEYSRYFRVRAQTSQGPVYLTQTGVDYDLDGHTVRVVGLAELGAAQDSYDDSYVEDQDNQIDIVLAGDVEAMRMITAVEVPSVAPYSPLYNPGGPGNNPTPGVRYSAPSPPHEQAVLMAIDDPMTVTFIDPAIERPDR